MFTCVHRLPYVVTNVPEGPSLVIEEDLPRNSKPTGVDLHA
jgi:hypothetical protein